MIEVGKLSFQILYLKVFVLLLFYGDFLLVTHQSER